MVNFHDIGNLFLGFLVHIRNISDTIRESAILLWIDQYNHANSTKIFEKKYEK